VGATGAEELGVAVYEGRDGPTLVLVSGRTIVLALVKMLRKADPDTDALGAPRSPWRAGTWPTVSRGRID
jgi:hypothetical protein